MKYLNSFSGTCHCGLMRFQLRTNKNEKDIVPRNCQCDLCKRHGASWMSDPEGEAHIYYDDKDKVSFYRFGTKTADFLVCRECGVLMAAVCDIENRKRSVLNSKAILDHQFDEFVQTDFSGENVDDRLERRGKNWTGNTIMTEGMANIGR